MTTTKQDLAKVRETLTTTEGLLEGKKAELAQKIQEAETCKLTVADKSRDLEQTKAELANLQDEMKKIQDIAGSDDFKNIGSIREKLAAQAEEGKILGQQLIAMRSENSALRAKVEELSVTPVNLRGKVAAVQDKWGFVVLDLGRSNRVQTNTNFLVYRDTKLISKVQVRDVGQTTSIAEVLPEFTKSTPRVGDLVVH